MKTTTEGMNEAVSVYSNRKDRVNWTISKDCLRLLQQAKSLDNKPKSLSAYVEYAIRCTYKNKLDVLREKMQFHAQELARLQELKTQLEDTK